MAFSKSKCIPLSKIMSATPAWPINVKTSGVNWHSWEISEWHVFSRHSCREEWKWWIYAVIFYIPPWSSLGFFVFPKLWIFGGSFFRGHKMKQIEKRWGKKNVFLPSPCNKPCDFWQFWCSKKNTNHLRGKNTTHPWLQIHRSPTGYHRVLASQSLPTWRITPVDVVRMGRPPFITAMKLYRPFGRGRFFPILWGIY